jgi:hypothetical protein
MQIFVFELKEEKKMIVMSYLMEFVHDKELTFSRHEFGTEVRNEKAFRACSCLSVPIRVRVCPGTPGSGCEEETCGISTFLF